MSSRDASCAWAAERGSAARPSAVSRSVRARTARHVVPGAARPAWCLGTGALGQRGMWYLAPRDPRGVSGPARALREFTQGARALYAQRCQGQERPEVFYSRASLTSLRTPRGPRSAESMPRSLRGVRSLRHSAGPASPHSCACCAVSAARSRETMLAPRRCIHAHAAQPAAACGRGNIPPARRHRIRTDATRAPHRRPDSSKHGAGSRAPDSSRGHAVSCAAPHRRLAVHERSGRSARKRRRARMARDAVA